MRKLSLLGVKQHLCFARLDNVIIASVSDRMLLSKPPRTHLVLLVLHRFAPLSANVANVLVAVCELAGNGIVSAGKVALRVTKARMSGTSRWRTTMLTHLCLELDIASHVVGIVANLCRVSKLKNHLAEQDTARIPEACMRLSVRNVPQHHLAEKVPICTLGRPTNCASSRSSPTAHAE